MRGRAKEVHMNPLAYFYGYRLLDNVFAADGGGQHVRQWP
jgi:hypothetical protein